MKKALLAALLLMAACQRPFEIDPAREYTPGELARIDDTNCNRSAPWEGKTVTVVGQIDRANVQRDSLRGDRFQLKNSGTADGTGQRLDVYVRNATAPEKAQILDVVSRSGTSTVAVTGRLVAWSMATQLKCRKRISIEIDQAGAITVR